MNTTPSIGQIQPGSPSRDHYGVIVVGARAAGAATAMLLARRGVSVLAIERAAEGSDTLSTHSLGRAAVLQLNRWGVLDRIRAAGTPVTRTVEFHYGGEPVVIDVSAPGEPVDGLYSPRRTVLDPILVAAARDAGAEVRHGFSVVDLVSDSAGRVVGVEIATPGGRRRIGANWVVGADGVRSVVARRAGAALTDRESSSTAIVYGYWNGLPDDVLINMFDEPGSAVGIVPTNEGRACVWVAMTPERFRAESRGDVRGGYHRAIDRHPPLSERLDGCTCVGGYRAFPGVPGFRRRAVGRGWSLVGDAGYFKDPITAHGITDAFIAAELLAEALCEIRPRRADPTVALVEYERDRDALASMVAPDTARLASLRLPPAAARAAFKRLSRAFAHEVSFIESRLPSAA